MRTHTALFLLAATTACSSEATSPTTTSNTGGQVATAGTGGSAGTAAGNGGTTAGGGSAGTPGGSAGAAGMVGTAGTVGAAGAAGATGGSAGAGGTAGAAGAGGTGGVSLTMGVQTDPGMEGDGSEDQPGPYTDAPEELSLLNGATAGVVTGPFTHVQTGTYTDWDTWTFTYYVFVPAEYQAGKPAALMVFNDGYLYSDTPGFNEESHFNVPTVFPNLIHEGKMPVTIAVFIWPGTNDGHKVGGGDGGRSVQYDSPNDQYGKFITEEFLPTEILPNYDIVTDADGWAMAGHSSGGIASIICGWYWSDKFHKLLTASPSFPNRGGVFPDEFNSSPTPKPLRIYHLSGTQDLGGFYDANVEAAGIFETLGYHYRFRPGEDQHYPPQAAMEDFPDALRWLWRNYTLPYYATP